MADHAEAFLQLGGFDWYTLVGDVYKGVVASPGGIPDRFEEHLQSNGCPTPQEPDEAFADDPYDLR